MAVALALIAVCGVVAFLLWPDPSSKQVLPDGTVLVMSGVKVGRTNVYSHGTGISKVLGRFTPSNAVSVAGFKLQRPQLVIMPAPEGGEILTAELWLGPGSPQEKAFTSPPFYRKHRLLISGDDADGFTFVKEINNFRKQNDGLFSLVWAWSYPRDSRQLRFRLEERETPNTRDWREVTTFVVRNPKRAQVEPWQPMRSSRIKLADGLEAEVGELAVRREPINTNDIWDYTAFLPVRVLRNGQMGTNWGIQGGKIWDASGNYDSFSYGFTKTITNNWAMYRMHRPLDPTKVWKFQVGFARDSDFPATNLFSFTVTWPLINAIHTNFGRSPVLIDFVNTDMLSVQLTNRAPQLRLTFIKAEDDAGNNLAEHTGSWGQHGFWKMLKLRHAGSPSPMQVHATVAIDENYETEFMLQPRYETKAKP
jgi:hypothetical protein